MNEQEIAVLALHSLGNILPQEDVKWLGDWTRLPSPEYETKFLQHYLGNISKWRPKKWELGLGVFLKDESREEAIGSINIRAENFLAARTVKTGSWVIRDFQSQGYGKEMREAVLAFVFKNLEARQARSSADPENKASIQISTSLGYQQDGTEERRDGSTKQRFILKKEDWQGNESVQVFGFESCRDFFLPKHPHHAP